VPEDAAVGWRLRLDVGAHTQELHYALTHLCGVNAMLGEYPSHNAILLGDEAEQ
jgi:hypothetical protein